MEQITYHVDKDILYIAIAGRVDASNAPAVEQEYFQRRTPCHFKAS